MFIDPEVKPIESPQAPSPITHQLWHAAYGASLAITFLAAVAVMVFFFTTKLLTSTDKESISLVRYSQTEASLNRFWPDASGSSQSYDVNRQIFEGLVRFSDQNHLEPLLATNWSRTGDNQWTFQLRSGVKFHNGHLLTASIVRDSLNADIKSPVSSRVAGNITKVEAVGSQIRITTSHPDSILPNKLAELLIYDTTSAQKNGPGNGTGPYSIKRGSVITASHLRLAAVGNYYGAYQRVREIDITATSASSAGAYRRNQIDLGLVSYKDKLGDRAYSLLQAPTQSVWALAPNLRRAGSPAANASVREAIALTIDSNSIIKTASLADDPTNQVLPKNAPGYSQSIKAQAHNLDTARQRLQQAGYGGGVTLRFAYGSSESPTAVMLKSQLAEVGINVALLPQASSQSLEAIYQAGTADFYLLSYTVSNLDSGGVLLSVLQSPLYQNASAATLLNSAEGTFDTGQRNELLTQISELIASDRIVIPLYSDAPSLYICDPSYVIHKDVPGPGLGVYFGTVYSKK